MTIGRIIDKILKYHAKALLRTDVRKPFAWALYHTWQDIDKQEKPRKESEA